MIIYNNIFVSDAWASRSHFQRSHDWFF